MTVNDELMPEEVAVAEDNTPLLLWTWGLSGQPASWAPTSDWQAPIQAIRSANRGETEAVAVQELLDATWPEGGYQAVDVVLAHSPTGLFTVGPGADALSVRVDLAGDQDLGLPDENVEWDFGDGSGIVRDAGGWEHTYSGPGQYTIRFTVLVAGAIYTSTQQAIVGVQPAVESEPYDPADDTVAGVLAYAGQHPDDIAAIRVAEEQGKNRAGVLDGLDKLEPPA